jgi:hypothetical protein
VIPVFFPDKFQNFWSADMARVLISDALSPAAVQIFKDAG